MVNFATYNVRGLSDWSKCSKVFKFIRDNVFDVVFLQETHSNKKCEKLWKSQFGGQIFYSHRTTAARGCAILIKRHVKTVVHKVVKDNEGRFIILDLTVRNTRMIICNIYAPNEDKIEFFIDVFAQIESFENGKVIIGGDFNTTLMEIDKKGGNEECCHPKCSMFIRNYMENRGLLDIWRQRNKELRRFTWHRKNPKIVFERLDYFLLTSHLSSQVLIMGVDPAFMSDHSIPFVGFKSLAPDKGPGYWRLRNEMACDETFLEQARTIINEDCQQYHKSKLRWEMIKMDVRGIAKQRKVRKRKSEVITLEALYRKQAQVHKQRDEINVAEIKLFDDCQKQLELIQKDIQEIIAKQQYKASIGNQAKWLAFGEKNSSYFFALERCKQKMPVVNLQIQGKLLKEAEQILVGIKEFYQDLFASTGNECYQEYLNDVDIPKLTEDEKAMLDEPLSVAEIEIAIKQLKSDSAAGIDGLPMFFYQALCQELKHILHALYLKCIEDGKFHRSATESVISLLEKVGKDQLYLGNWRPLSLLCCDYKIFITNHYKSY